MTLRAQFRAHQQREEFRIGGEGTAIRMVGREEDLLGILDEQEELQTRRPLDGVVVVRNLVGVRHDAAAIGVAVEDRALLRARRPAGC